MSLLCCWSRAGLWGCNGERWPHLMTVSSDCSLRCCLWVGELIGNSEMAIGHLSRCSVTAETDRDHPAWPVSAVLETHRGPGIRRPWEGPPQSEAAHFLPYGGRRHMLLVSGWLRIALLFPRHSGAKYTEMGVRPRHLGLTALWVVLY